MGTDRFGLQSLVKQAEPDKHGYDPDHPYKSRYDQWSMPGKRIGTVLGAGLTGTYLGRKPSSPYSLPLIVGGALAGNVAGGAITGAPGLIHGALSQRRDRPHEWNEDMSNALDKVKNKLSIKTSSSKDRYGLTPLIDKTADIMEDKASPWSILPGGSSVIGYKRGGPSGRRAEGVLRGILGGTAGGLVGAQLGHVHPLLGIAGGLTGDMYGTHLATRGLLPQKSEESNETQGVAHKAAFLQPNLIEEQAYVDALEHYKIAAPVANMFRNALQGAKTFGTQLSGARGAIQGAFQANKAFGTPTLSNLGQSAQEGWNHLKDSGGAKTLGRIGRIGGLAGAGFLAGRATAPQQQQRPPQNPYGQAF